MIDRKNELLIEGMIELVQGGWAEWVHDNGKTGIKLTTEGEATMKGLFDGKSRQELNALYSELLNGKDA